MHSYQVIELESVVGVIYREGSRSPDFLTGHVRMRGRPNGSYPFHYLDMIDEVFGHESNTIEVCSGDLEEEVALKVDINQAKNARHTDGQTLDGISDNQFDRWRCDPPYNQKTAMKMYNTALPSPMKLLTAGARVIKPGSLMFLLLGPVNYQMCPRNVKRIGFITISVIPNNEFRCLNIYQKRKDNVT